MGHFPLFCDTRVRPAASLCWTSVCTLVDCGWRCVQHFRFSCKASQTGCPDPTDLWLDLLDPLSCDAVAAARVRQALHVDSFDPAAVHHFCLTWLLDPFCILSAGPCSVGAVVCSILARYVLLVGVPVADAVAHAGDRVFAAGLVLRCLRPLSLLPSSCCQALPPLLLPLWRRCG
jgi:hypothetical protein